MLWFLCDHIFVQQANQGLTTSCMFSIHLSAHRENLTQTTNTLLLFVIKWHVVRAFSGAGWCSGSNVPQKNLLSTDFTCYAYYYSTWY
jgi:hypothetical protein